MCAFAGSQGPGYKILIVFHLTRKVAYLCVCSRSSYYSCEKKLPPAVSFVNLNNQDFGINHFKEMPRKFSIVMAASDLCKHTDVELVLDPSIRCLLKNQGVNNQHAIVVRL